MSIKTWSIPFESYRGADPYVFVSYSHQDHEPMFPILHALYRAGFRLWYDEGIGPATEWAEEVAKALAQCRFFLVFLSPQAVGSNHVRDEIYFALDHAKPFLAVHLQPTELPPGLQLRIGKIQALLRYRMDEGKLLEKISEALGAFAVRTEEEAGFLEAGSLGGVRVDPDFDAERAYYDLSAAHHAGDWACVRRVGPQLATSLLQRAARGETDLSLLTHLLNTAVFLDDGGELSLAKRCLLAVTELLLELRAKHGESVVVLDHLGMTYNNLGRLVRKRNAASRAAESYYRKSMEVFELLYPDLSDELNLGDRLGMACTNLGNSLRAQGKADAAAVAYRRALAVYEKLAADHPGSEHIAKRLVEARRDVA